MDQIVIAWPLIEEIREQNERLIMTFVDFAKAFGSINHVALWKIQKHLQNPGRGSAYGQELKPIETLRCCPMQNCLCTT